MDNPDELKNLLQRNLETSEESLKILRKIHRDVLWKRFFGTLKFLIATGLLVWAYLQVQPLLEKVLNLYQNLPKVQQNFDLKNLPPEIKKLFEKNP